MISTANTLGFQREWFHLTEDSPLPYAIPKAEYWDLVQQTVKELEQQSARSYASLRERVQTGAKVDLTEDQKRDLSENFDPENMTRSGYQAFIDKLCEFGILDEADKPYVGYGVSGSNLDLTPLDSVRTGGFLSPAGEHNPMAYTNAFSSSRGNVLDWARYLSGLREMNQNTFAWERTPEAVLFGKIYSVLNGIS